MTATSAFIPHCPNLLTSSTWTPSSTSLRHHRHTLRKRTTVTSCTSSQQQQQPPTSSSLSTPSTPIPLAPPISDIWELDFYSRPVVGLDGKKLWELIIVDATNTFEFIEPVPNTLVNSRELRKRIQSAIDIAPKPPRTIRFFRSQMFNMIQIALSEIPGILIAPTRKTYALYKTLNYRQSTIYPSMPGFKSSLASSSSFSKSRGSGGTISGGGIIPGFSDARRMPDALRCEKFAFGDFPLSDLLDFFNQSNDDDFYGDACPVDDQINNKDLSIPGIIAFSKRASTLSAWIDGVELVFIQVIMQQREVVFECGLNTVYRFAQITDDIKNDVKRFQQLKQESAGLHFLAIQESPESEEVEGMWLMSEVQQ